MMNVQVVKDASLKLSMTGKECHSVSPPILPPSKGETHKIRHGLTGMTPDRGVCWPTVLQRQWMFPTRIASELIPGRVAAKAYSLGLQPQESVRIISVPWRGTGNIPYPPPLQGGFRLVVLNLGLEAPSYMPPGSQRLRSEETTPLPGLPDVDAQNRA